MSLANKFTMKLNTKEASNKFIPVVTANDTTIFEFEVYDGKEKIELLETYNFNFVTKPVGKGSVLYPAELNEDGKVVVELNFADVNHGLCDCALVMYEEEKRVSTMRMKVDVKGDLALQGDLPSESRRLIIADEAQLTRAVEVANEIEQARGNAGTIGGRFDEVTSRLADITSENRVEKTSYVEVSKIFEEGYYAFQDGQLINDAPNGYYHLNIDVSVHKQFYIKHPKKVLSLRVGFFNGNSFINTVQISSGSLRTAPANATRMFINFPIRGLADPASTLTNYDDLTELESIVIKVKMPIEPSNISLANRISNLESNRKNKTIKILGIGNSFTQDAFNYLVRVANTVNVNVIVGVANVGSSSLQIHYTNTQNNNNSYLYQKWTPQNDTRVVTEWVNLNYCLFDEDWDYIFLQQVSGLSGVYSTFQPFLNNLIAYIKERAINPDMRLGLHMTWAYARNHVNEDYATYYNNDQMTMYNAIVDAYQSAMIDSKIDFILPTGTAIQNGRTNEKLVGTTNDFTVDGFHITLGIPQIITAYTIFEALLEPIFKKDLMKDVTYPYTSDSDRMRGYLAKIAAKNAVLNPFKVTSV